jgi:hypothetical protein
MEIMKSLVSLLLVVALGLSSTAGNFLQANDADQPPDDPRDEPDVIAPGDPPLAPLENLPPAANEDPFASPVRVQVDTTRPEFDGQVIAVEAGDDLQAAIDAASPGDVIELEPGAVFTGAFVLPVKDNPDSRWILIRTAGVQPPEGKRIDPSVHAGTMAVIQSPERNTAPAIKTTSGSSHYRFENLAVRAHQDSTEFKHRVYNLVYLSHSENVNSTTLTLEHLPHHIVFDRVLAYGNPRIGTRRGFTLNGRHLAVINSHLTEFKERGADSQAIGGWSGSGPFRIENNFLAGAGENIMFGGADAVIEGLVPSDIEILRNHFFKPLSWREDDPAYEGTRWVVKNLLEFKSGQRILVEGNVFENHWGGQGQSGYAILFTPRAARGRNPWVVVQDVLFQHNTLTNISQGINFLGEDSNKPNDTPTNNIVIHQNLFEGLGAFDTRAYWLLWNRTTFHTTISNNTVRFANAELNHGISVCHNSKSQGRMAQAKHVTFVDNVVEHQQYGFKGDGLGIGAETLETNFPDLHMSGNFFVQKPGDKRNLAERYPSDETFTNNTFVEADEAFDPGNAGVDMELLRQKQRNP